MKQQPVRLMDDLRVSGMMRDDVRAAAADPGPRYDVDAGAQRFATLVENGVVASSGAAANAGTTRMPFLGKIGGKIGSKIGAVVLVGLVGGGGAFVLKVSSRTGASGGASGTTSSAPTSAGQLPPPAFDPAPSAVAASEVSASRTAAESPGKPRSSVVSAVRRVPSRPRPVIVAPSGPADDASPTSETKQAVEPDHRSLKEEMSHLAELRAVARTNPARAVAMVREGHARFERGVFWQERELLAITSLISLSQKDEARVRAAAVLKQHPESPSAETLRRLIQGP